MWYLRLFCWYRHLLSWLVLMFKNHEYLHQPSIRLGPSAGTETADLEARSGGRSGSARAEPNAQWVWKKVIFKPQNQSRQKVKILRKNVWDTQPNPRYSAKNNVAICMIAPFMPILFYLSFILLFHMFTSLRQIFKLVIIKHKKIHFMIYYAINMHQSGA